MEDLSDRERDVEASEDGLEDTINEETLVVVVNVGESGVLFLVDKLVVAV